MSNYLNILYHEKEHDAIFSLLKRVFGQQAAEVEVDQIVPDTYVAIRWKTGVSPNDIASKLTEEIPNIVIECPSNTGIDTVSRYFNKSQLW